MAADMAERYLMPLSHDDGRLAPSDARDVIQALLRTESDPKYAAAWPSVRCPRASGEKKRSRHAQEEEESRKDSLARCYHVVPADFSHTGGRAELACLLISISDHYGKDREVVEAALSCLDRALLGGGSSPPRLRDLFRRALACLSLSVKLLSPCSGHPLRGRQVNELLRDIRSRRTSSASDSRPPQAIYDALGINSSLVAESRGAFDSAGALASAESHVCRLLRFRIHPPTTAAFVRAFFELVSPRDCDDAVALGWARDAAFHQADLALCGGSALARPSIVAAAAVRNAVRFHGLQNRGEGSCGRRCRKLDELREAIDGVLLVGDNEGGSNPEGWSNPEGCDVRNQIRSVERSLEVAVAAAQQSLSVDGSAVEAGAPATPRRETQGGPHADNIDTPPLVSETEDIGTPLKDGPHVAKTGGAEDFGSAAVRPIKRHKAV